jgi:hypothetical protein
MSNTITAYFQIPRRKWEDYPILRALWQKTESLKFLTI